MNGEGLRPFSDRLLEAATRIDELPSEEIARLLMKAARRLRVVRAVGANLEHIPVYAYHLLRRLAEYPVLISTLHGQEDEAAVAFLVSRELAVMGAGDLRATANGSEIGEIADERY